MEMLSKIQIKEKIDAFETALQELCSEHELSVAGSVQHIQFDGNGGTQYTDRKISTAPF